MAGKADWSLANRLRARALMATAAITLLMSAVVALESQVTAAEAEVATKTHQVHVLEGKLREVRK